MRYNGPMFRSQRHHGRLRARFLPVVLLLALLCLPLQGASYLKKRFTLRDGLPQNTVQAVTRTPDGLLWVGTRDGLARFDGDRFEVLELGTPAAPARRDITALAATPDGTLWIGTRGAGLYRYAGGIIRSYGETEGLAGTKVSAIATQGNDLLWVSFLDGGLTRIEKGKIVSFTVADGAPYRSTAVTLTADGSVYAGGWGSGLFLFDGKRFSKTGGGPLPFSWVDQLSADAAGGVIAATWGGLLYRQGDAMKTHSLPGDTIRRRVTATAGHYPDDLWIGLHSSGLYRFSDGDFAPFDIPGIPPGEQVTALHRDRDGLLWVGTGSSGLALIAPLPFTLFPAPPEAGEPQIRSLLVKKEGTVLAALWGIGLAALGEKGLTALDIPALRGATVTALYEDKTGIVWIGTHGNGIIRLRGTKSDRIPPEALPDGVIYAIAGDTKGTVWAATQGGLARFDEHGAISRPDADGLCGGGTVTGLFNERNGTLWALCRNGTIVRHDGDRFAPVNPGTNAPLTAITGDEHGRLYLLTAGQGLVLRSPDGRFIPLGPARGMPSQISAALTGRDGILHLCTPEGIALIASDELTPLLKDPDARLSPRLIPFAAGNEPISCGAPFSPAAARGGDGTLYFASDKGLLAFSPDTVTPLRSPPIIDIRLAADGTTLSSGPDHTLPVGSLHLAIGWRAAEFLYPDRVAYRYRLDGWDRDWVATTGHAADYLRLPAGQYSFHVSSSVAGGAWSDPRTVAFTVPENGGISEPAARFLVRASLATILLLIAGSILIGVLYRLRLRRIEQKAGELEEEVQEREAELTEVITELRQKYEHSHIDDTAATDIAERLERLMKTGSLWRDPLLTLTAVADKLNISPHNLSQVLNCRLGRNFYTFVNHYRIEEMKALLDDPSRHKDSILAIAYECGFNSKSSFNTLFKKETGMTPSEYRNRHL